MEGLLAALGPAGCAACGAGALALALGARSAARGWAEARAPPCEAPGCGGAGLRVVVT